MNLPENFSVFDKRNRRELAVLKAENALMSWMIHPPVIFKSNRDLVRSAFNGHPITRAQILTELNLRHPFLKITSKEVNDAVGDLLRGKELQPVDNKKWGRAFIKTVASLAPVLVLLLTGCSIIKEPFDRLEQQPVAPELQLPSHFTTPVRALAVHEKRTPSPAGSRRSRALVTTWTAYPSWLLHDNNAVTGYVVGWGEADGAYTNTLVVNGRENTNASVNVARGKRWYFAVKATTPNGESAYSPSVIRTVPGTNVVEIQDTIMSAPTPDGPWVEFHRYPAIKLIDPIGSEVLRGRLSITNYLAE